MGHLYEDTQFFTCGNEACPQYGLGCWPRGSPSSSPIRRWCGASRRKSKRLNEAEKEDWAGVLRRVRSAPIGQTVNVKRPIRYVE
jgi:hypothetical protein